MSRYDPYGGSNWGHRILGRLFLAMLALAALIAVWLGLKWLWQYFQ